jgi:hypothetical protein
MTRLDWRKACRTGAPVRYPDLDRAPLVRTQHGTITPRDVRSWTVADYACWILAAAAWAVGLGLFL